VDTDRNLLFGVLAMQCDAITRVQFVDACALWANQKERPLADLLAERGWLSATDRQDVERLVARKLNRHGGDARTSLAELAGGALQLSLAEIGDPEVRQSLGLPDGPSGHILLATMAYEPGTRERYTLTRLHAQGGIGQVWLARDQAFGREVALKELRPERAENPAAWARFLEEARITGQLEHPNIVPVHELAEPAEGRRPFYTMRFVKGRTLSDAARAYHGRRREGTAGPLELRELLGAFVGVGQAVAYAHSRGVIHRDLKGQNVVLGDFGEVIVLDWGLAKVVGRAEETLTPPVAAGGDECRGETLQGQALGTPGFMSPEQAQGQWDAVDRRTDVYGLGAILYEVLTGQAPFDGTNTADVLRRVVAEPPARPRSVNPAVPPALEAACLKALVKQPAERYPTAEALTADVKAWMADEPVSAYREPPVARAGRWARRHRPLVAGAAALLVAAVVALSAGTVLLSRANARTEAERQRAEAARAEAEENFRKARQAVDDYFTKVSESRLLNVPGLQPLRKELLESAQAYYEEFLRHRGDDPKLRAEAGAAAYRVAMITQLLGAVDRARPMIEQARAAYLDLTRNHPEVAKYWVDLAICDNDLGRLYHATGDRETAARFHREALEIRERNAREHPDAARFQDELGRSYSNLAMIALDDGRAAEALRLTEQITAILERAVGDAPPATRLELPTDLGNALNTVGALRAALAGHYKQRGYLLRRVGRTDEAVRSYRKSLAAFESLMSADPGNLIYESGYAGNGAGICSMLEFMGYPHEARAAAAKVKPVAERLVAENPSVPGYRTNLAVLFMLQGNIDLKEGRPGAAARWFKEALAVYERLRADDPQYAYYQHRVAAACRHLGTIPVPHLPEAEAQDYLRRSESLLKDLHNPDTTSVYDLACAQALIAGRLGRGPERDQYEQRAMETFRRSVTAGYKDLANIRADTDLDALRSRDDFKQVLAGLDAEEMARTAANAPAAGPGAALDGGAAK
jgi:serine/threonine-protein kinase